MLSALKIENIAIIESAELSFGIGLNVLTGETGAGKSILIDAIHAVLGERTSRDLIRSGADSARVSALFSCTEGAVAAALAQLDLPPAQEGELLLQRTLQADGRNSCRVNGEPVSVAMLKALGRELIGIHGQHDNQALLNAERHCGFLDALAGNEILRAQYAQGYTTLQGLQKEKDTLQTDETQKARELDMLNFQIDELENAALREGEQEELTARRTLFLNAEKVQQALHLAYAALQGDEENAGAADALSLAADNLEEASAYYAETEPAAAAVREMSYDLAEHIGDIRRALDAFEYDPQELAEIEERLDVLYRLSRKYGAAEADMLAFLAQAIEKRESITLSEERLAALEKHIRTAQKEVTALAAQLRETRQSAAAALEEGITRELAFLDMPNVRFTAQLREIPPGSNGADAVEFLISANAGEEPRPLAKIASGGELSRMMLAIKNVLADKDEIGCMIFDEIDTGVSGRAAQKIALKLREVSRGRQVICVTHLAQIAAQADLHMQIYKEVLDGKTYTRVLPLNKEARIAELARITGGLEVTQLQLDSAAEMLRNAQND